MTAAILILYTALACIDAYASEHHGNRLAKCFLIPCLAIILLIAENQDIFLYLALLLCMAGDIFLIEKTSLRMKLGTGAFLLGHVCYIVCFVPNSAVPIIPSAAMLVCYAAAGMMIGKQLVPHEKGIKRLGLAVYICLLLSMSWMSFNALIADASLGSFLSWSGTVCFVVSDTLIGLQHVHHQEQKGVMQTYSAAQALIVIGQILQ
jgi:uncharacterized membrane protein YhhN